MLRNGFTPVQIIAKLREAEVVIAQGKSVGQAVRKIGVKEQTCYRLQNRWC